MYKKAKRLLSLALVIALVLSICSVGALASDTVQDDPVSSSEPQDNQAQEQDPVLEEPSEEPAEEPSEEPSVEIEEEFEEAEETDDTPVFSPDGDGPWIYSGSVIIPPATSGVTALSRSTVILDGIGVNGKLMSLVIDGVEMEYKAGEYEGDTIAIYATEYLAGTSGVLGSWTGLKGLKYRAGLYINNGKIENSNSVTSNMVGTYETFTSESTTSGFSAVIVKNSDYVISGSTIIADTVSDGTDVNDFAGYGAAVAVYGDSLVEINDTYIETTGVAKAATFVDDGGDLIVRNSELIVNGGDIYSGYYSTADQKVMINPPWVLGISGSARTTNIMGANTTGTYVDSTIKAADWGALSIDTGSNMLMTAINSEVIVEGSGYGAYAIGTGTQEYFLGTSFDVETYAVILTGSSVTFGSYTGGQKIEINKISGGRNVATVSSIKVQPGEVINSTVDSDEFGFMMHANGNTDTNNLTIKEGTVVNSGNAAFLVKKVNNIITVDGAEINVDDGVILQMIDNDDDLVGVMSSPPSGFGMPTFNLSFNEQDGWSSEWGITYKKNSNNWYTNLNVTDTALEGNIYNGTGYSTTGASALNITLGEGATLTGAIAATEYQHEYKSFAYRTSTGGYDAAMAAEAAAKLGHVINQNYYNGYNDVSVKLVDGAVWTVTEDSLISSLYIEDGSSVVLPAGAVVTVNGAEVELQSSVSYTGTIAITISGSSDLPTAALTGNGPWTYANGVVVPEGLAVDGKLLTMTVDGVETRIAAGEYTGNVVFTATDYFAAALFGSSIPNYRTGLFVNNGAIDSSRSVLSALVGGTYDDESADGVSITSRNDQFAGFIINNSAYTITDAKIDFVGDAGNDFGGFGAGLAVTGGSDVTVNDSEIYVKGNQRSTIFVGSDDSGNPAHLTVNNSTIQGEDSDTAGNTGVWVFGVTGNNRATNVVGYARIAYNNSTMKSQGWGVLATDDVRAPATQEQVDEKYYSVMIDVKDSVIEALDPDQNVYGSYSIGACFNSFDNTVLNVSGFAMVVANEYAGGQFVNGTVVNSGRFGIQWHFNQGGETIIADSTFNTGLTTFLIKECSPIITVSKSVIKADNGVIMQVMDSDDPGLGGSTAGTYDDTVVAKDASHDVYLVNSTTISNFFSMGPGGFNYTYVTDAQASFADMSLEGDFYNAANRSPRNMVLGFDNADITGVISSSTAVHPVNTYDKDKAFSEEGSRASLGVVENTASPTINNGVIVTLTNGSTWTVAGTSYLTSLTLDAASSIVAPAGYEVAMTVNGFKEDIEAGKSYSGAIVLEVVEAGAVGEAGPIYVSSFEYRDVYNGAGSVTLIKASAVIDNVTFTAGDDSQKDITIYNAVTGQTSTQTVTDEGVTVVTPSGLLTTLTVDGVQYDFSDFMDGPISVDSEVIITYTENVFEKSNGGPGSAAGVKEQYRSALYVAGGEIYEAGSVLAAADYTVTGSGLSNVTINSQGEKFNGILINGASSSEASPYVIDNANIILNGHGGDDFMGWGAGIMVTGGSNVSLRNSFIESNGAIRTAIIAGYTGDRSGTKLAVENTVIIGYEADQTEQSYIDLAVPMMKWVPFGLGLTGNHRITSVLGNAEATYKDSIVVAEGWGVLSTDSGISGSDALTTDGVLAGIGSLEVAQAGKAYTDTMTVNGTEYGFTVGRLGESSGYVSYADQGVTNVYTNSRFYAPDYLVISAAGKNHTTLTNVTGVTERIGFLWHQSSGGQMTINGGSYTVNETMFMIKSQLEASGAGGNTAYTDIVVDGAELNIVGKEAYSGVLLQLLPTDATDGGPTGTTCEIPAEGPDTAKSGQTISAANAYFSNVEVEGDIYNSMQLKEQWLNAAFTNSTITGVISSSWSYHVDVDGEKITTSTDGATLYIENAGDYLTLGRVVNVASETVDNPVGLTLNGAVWNVTGTSYLSSLTLDSASSLVGANGETIAITVNGSEITMAEIIAAGTITGNIVVTIEDEPEPVSWVIRNNDPEVEQRIILNSAYIVSGTNNQITDNRDEAEIGTNNYTSSNGRGASAIYVTDEATAEFNNSIITGNGILDASDLREEYASKYGYASAALVNNGGTLILRNPTIISNTSSYANGGYSSDVGSKLYVYGGTITTNNTLGHGLDATYQGYIYAEDVVIKTGGGNSAAIATDFQGGIIDLYRITATTARSGSPGIYTAGKSVITAHDSSFTATGGEGVMLAHSDGYTYLYDSSVTGLTGINAHNYQTMYGPEPSYLIMEGGSVTSTTGALLSVSDGYGDMTFNGVAFNIAEGREFIAAGQGTLIVNAKNIAKTIVGDVTMSRTTALTLNLENSALQGAVTATTLTLDAKSAWIVTGNSSITNLTIAEGACVSAPAGKKLVMKVDGVEKPVAAGSYTGVELYTKDAVTVELRADAKEVILSDGVASYTMSLTNAKVVTLAAINFKFTGNASEGYTAVLENSFEVFESLAWAEFDASTSTGQILIMNTDGFTSAELADILRVALNVEGYGDVTLSITGMKITYIDETTGKSAYAELISGELSATVKVVEVFSKYDISGDGIVDLLDLSDLLYLHFLKDAGSSDWESVKIYDYNGDGIIDILDLYILYKNFS